MGEATERRTGDSKLFLLLQELVIEFNTKVLEIGERHFNREEICQQLVTYSMTFIFENQDYEL